MFYEFLIFLITNRIRFVRIHQPKFWIILTSAKFRLAACKSQAGKTCKSQETINLTAYLVHHVFYNMNYFFVKIKKSALLQKSSGMTNWGAPAFKSCGRISLQWTLYRLLRWKAGAPLRQIVQGILRLSQSSILRADQDILTLHRSSSADLSGWASCVDDRWEISETR